MSDSSEQDLVALAAAWILAQLRHVTNVDDFALGTTASETRDMFHSATSTHHGFQQLRRLELSQTELAVVTTLAAVQYEPEVSRMLGALSPDLSNAIRVLVYGASTSRVAFEELGAAGALRRLGIIEPLQMLEGDRALRWRLCPRILGLLHGVTSQDRCFRLVCPVDSSNAPVVSAGVSSSAARAIRSSTALVVTAGLRGLGRRTTLVAAAQAANLNVLEVHLRHAAVDAGAFQTQLRSIALECALNSAVPLLDDIELLCGENDQRLALVGSVLVPLIHGAILITSGAQPPVLDWGRPLFVIEMGQPTTTQRASLWHASLGEGTPEDAQLLAEQYPLAPALIVRASEAAKARANGRALEPDDIYSGIRSVLDDRLGQFAKRVTVTQTWDDLVLPADQLDTITELMARVRGRSKVYEQWGFAAKVGKGLGVSALFSGPPGTGKTMVAALIARDLGLELYQVDMGKLVSKFIGETEKNLGALFDAAEAGHAILLFDEADSLFGKRTDVKSSNDRYANLETNYLLQRLESFTGICLLTTNHDSHIDPAFQRRLSLHLRFDVPEVEERALLWRATLPVAAPLANNVDFAALARRYAMSGGYIRNAALRAAFLAADEDSEITAAHLERAARVEYEGMGKIAA